MNQEERALSDALAALAESRRDAEAPDRVESAVLAEFRARRTRVRTQVRTWMAWAGVAAAVVLAVVGYMRQQGPVKRAPMRAVHDLDGFVAIGPGPVVEPDGFAPVVRLRLPSRDARAGVIEVDVVVGRDGVAKAVRFVRFDNQ